MKITCYFAADGTLTIGAGSITIASSYPAINGEPLRALHVAVAADGSAATWTLADQRSLTLTCVRDAEVVELRMRLSGYTTAPQTVSLLHGARNEGMTRGFRLAHGIGGGSRWFSLPAKQAEESSTLGGGSAADGSTLVLCSVACTQFAARLHWRLREQGTQIDWTYTCEGVPVVGDLVLPSLRITAGADAWSLLTDAASAVAAETQVCLPARRAVWCSWYYNYHHFTRADLDEILAGLAKLPGKGGVNTVQIDAGYSTFVGDWLEANALWPQGLESAFAAIRTAGYEAGIWIGPFMVGSRSRIAREHPEWLLRHTDGSLVTQARFYGEQRLWHYRDEEYYSLDTSHPQAFASMRTVFRTMASWGATYFKIDFLYWGMHDSSMVQRHVPGRTSVEYFRDVMAMIREEIGSSYLLGCIAPYAPTLGYVDGTRIAGDVGPSWSKDFGPVQMLNETSGTQILNERWFHNDPDAVLVRNFHSDLSETEVTSLALWQGFLAGNVCTSDPLHRCSLERYRLWQFLDPTGPAEPATIPRFGDERRYLIAVRRMSTDCYAVLVLNPGETPVSEVLRLDAVTPLASATVYPWGAQGAGTAQTSQELWVHVAPHASQLWLIDGGVTVVPLRISG